MYARVSTRIPGHLQRTEHEAVDGAGAVPAGDTGGLKCRVTEAIMRPPTLSTPFQTLARLTVGGGRYYLEIMSS